MVDRFLIDAVNKVFLDYSPLYSSTAVIEETIKESHSEHKKETEIPEHNMHNETDKEHEEHSREEHHEEHSHEEHHEEHSHEHSHEEHEKHDEHGEGHGEHEDVHKESEGHAEESSEKNTESETSGQENTISISEIQARLLLSLKEIDLWKPSTEISDEFRPISSRLESHIFEFQNKFIGADYPNIETRQIYSAFNPVSYSNSMGDVFFGEHHKINLYLENKPTYTAMRSEKVNIVNKSEFKPVYMRMKHS